MREILFLLNHKETFIKHICGCYPFSEDFIGRNKNYINWDFLSINEKLPWSICFIKKFYNSWQWDRLSGNECRPWSEELILKYSEKWGINTNDSRYELCPLHNNSILWSKKLVNRFADQMCGTWLAQRTELLNDHPEILEDFKNILWWKYIIGNEYMNWSEKLIDQFIPYWDWDCLIANEAIVWSKELKEKYKDRFNQDSFENRWRGRYASMRRNVVNTLEEEDKSVKVLYTLEEFERIRKLNSPGHMSLDERVPWSDDLIAKLEHEWNWDQLSFNRDLPWSENLIDRYIDKWDFGTFVDEPYSESYHTCGLSSNPGLPWSLKLLKKYESRWDWFILTTSEDIPWSIEILEEFKNKWYWERLMWNETMWQKVFYPCLDEEVIGALLTIINKKVYPF